jgi:hypothetical protein
MQPPAPFVIYGAAYPYLMRSSTADGLIFIDIQIFILMVKGD